jgi:hypothetical protein
MVFATAVAFLWQGRYGSLSAPLFLALIVSYIFKDRLKDFLRSSMSRGLRRFLSDRKRAIFRNFTLPVGICKETWPSSRRGAAPGRGRAAQPGAHGGRGPLVPQRDHHPLPQGDHPHPDRGPLSSSGLGGGMVDITRMGGHDFLRYMDEPEEPLYVLHGEGCRRVAGSKVYHVNMVRRLYGPDGVACRRYRLVLDRNGIKRIERIR